MDKEKLVLTSKLSREELSYITKRLEEDYEILIPENFKEDDILKVMDEDTEVVLGNLVTEEIIKKGNIKLIQNPFAGVENFDYDMLKKYEINLCNSHSNSAAVAEHALGMIFAIMRKIPYHDRLMRQGDWNRRMEEIDLFSTSIVGKTVGILGYGGIGRSLGKMMKTFDCKLLAMVRDKNKNYEELDFIGDESDLDYIVKNSDILVVTLPLTDKTEGLIGEREFSNMKEDAFLINMSRGVIVDEFAFYQALKEEKIAGGAVDTWYNYPENSDGITYPSKKYNFHKLNNLVLSPHRAPMTKGEMTNVLDAIENLKRYKNGEELINIVDLEEGY